MKERLFFYAGFSNYAVGLADEYRWIKTAEGSEYLIEHLTQAIAPFKNLCHWPQMSIFLVNGPGSTLGIRAFCAFIRTLLALEKIQPSQVFVSDAMHFIEACQLAKNPTFLQPICARINLTKSLCVSRENRRFHTPSAAEETDALWVSHPCLKQGLETYTLDLNDVLPILKPQHPWVNTDAPDVFLINSV